MCPVNGINQFGVITELVLFYTFKNWGIMKEGLFFRPFLIVSLIRCI